MKVADFIFTICIGAITFFFLFGAIPPSTQKDAAASHESRIKELEDKLAALITTVETNRQNAANEISATNANVSGNSNNINNLSQRVNAPVKHEDGKWVHIGGGVRGLREYTCPEGYVITGFSQRYHDGNWRHWIEKVHISRIVPAK